MVDQLPTSSSRRQGSTPPPSGVRARYLLILLGGLAFFALAIGVVVSNLGGDQDEVAVTGTTLSAAGGDTEGDYEVLEPTIDEDGTITYTIPPGTRARILAGEDIAVIPARLVVEVGQKVIIKNNDHDAHIAGPFFVGAGESSEYVFSEPKVIEGECTIHPSGQFTIEVIEA